MPSHWGYVLSAYGIAAIVLFWYWRSLERRWRALRGSTDGHEGARR